MSSTRISRRINARREIVYRALLDARSVAVWKVPNGSTRWDDRTLVDHALRLGNELLAMARKTRRGWSWPSFDEPKQEHLTDLAHGVPA